ncbi:MAG: threonine/serine dehydratase [Bacteroidota bacterium]
MSFSLTDIRQARTSLGEDVKRTPVTTWKSMEKDRLLSASTSVFVKLELFQHGGSFKARGALLNMMHLSQEELQRGVTAVSAGNHAIAVGYAAKVMGSSAKVVMPSNANKARVDLCRALGAEVVLMDNVTEAFAEVQRIQKEEGRFFVHPFDGRDTTLGTSTCGLEFHEQVGKLDALIIPVGGGGLAAGISRAFHLLNPECRVFGVEPVGADTMYRSFQTGTTQTLDKVRTIADSLGAPFSMEYSMKLCRDHMERIVLVDDEALITTMALMFSELKLAVEPACAAALAALLGPLKEELIGRRVGLIACGANIDPDTYMNLIQKKSAFFS